jgi:hypothetical protein
MNVKYVIFSCDKNPMYYDFWKYSSMVISNKLGLIPILFMIDDYDTNLIPSEYGFIKRIKQIDNISTSFQSQVVRMFGTQYFPNDVCIISDIDMFMFNKHYFVEQLKHYNENDFIVMSSDAYGNIPRYPMCYNIAKGSIFKEYLNIEEDFDIFCRKIYQTGYGWDSDEFYLFSYLLNKPHIKLNRGWESGKAINRIDRLNWIYDKNNIDIYIDCHSLRPIQNHKKEIEELLKYEGINFSIG